jgi:hypothetical protein
MHPLTTKFEDLTRALTSASDGGEKMKRMSGNRTNSRVIKRLKRQCAAHARQRNVHRGKLKHLGSPLHLEDVPVIS